MLPDVISDSHVICNAVTPHRFCGHFCLTAGDEMHLRDPIGTKNAVCQH